MFPGNSVDVDRIKQKGTYFRGQSFTNEAKFLSFIEANRVYGNKCKSNFHLYTIRRSFALKLKPSGYHKINFPSKSSMALICKSRFLVISQNRTNKSEKKQHFTSFRINGVMSIDLDSESSGHSESENEDDKEIDNKVTPYDDNDVSNIDNHFSPSFKLKMLIYLRTMTMSSSQLRSSQSNHTAMMLANGAQLHFSKTPRCYDDVSDDTRKLTILVVVGVR